MTTATYTADWNLGPSVNRRCSTETVYSVQDVETDIARDTSDTEPLSTDTEDGLEYEPVTESEQEAPIDDNTSASSDDDIIKTEVIAVSVRDDGDLQLADSECTDTNESDTDFKRHDFLRCVQCKGRNTNPIYRYCFKCFTMRKNFFPPRPRRNRKKSKGKSAEETTQLSQASSSGCLSQSTDVGYQSSVASQITFQPGLSGSNRLKRRAGSLDHDYKKPHYDSGTETDMDDPVQPVVKTVSDLSPISQIEPPVNITKKSIANTVLEKMDTKDLCVVCVSAPKSGVFVHGRIAHICCCYRCAVKVWTTARRCPVCNCRVSNVLRAVVM